MDWPSSTRGINQIWIQVRKRKVEKIRSLPMFRWYVGTLSKYGHFRNFPHNVTTWAHFFQKQKSFVSFAPSLFLSFWRKLNIRATLEKGQRRKVQCNQVFLQVKSIKLVPRPLDESPGPRQIKIFFGPHGIILEGQKKRASRRAHGLENQSVT